MMDRTNLRYLLRLLEHGPFERRPRGGWRFGTRWSATRLSNGCSPAVESR